MYGVVITVSRVVGEGIDTWWVVSSRGIQMVKGNTVVRPAVTVMPYSNRPYLRAP